MLQLGWEAWATLAIIVAILVALVKEIARPDMILLGALAPLIVLGILTPEEAFDGFSNSAVLAVGALFVVAAGVQNTGALNFADRLLFPRNTNVQVATVRLMGTTALLSAFLNNTPLVAMLIPRVQVWCETYKVSTSKLMIPLSFAAIVGGMTTLIGTSTNLLVSGLMESSGVEGLGMFDLAWVGVPAALAVVAYFGMFGYRMLPDRGSLDDGELDDLGNRLFELRVAPGSSHVGQTIESAGLRALGDAYLAHILSEEAVVPAAPDTVLRAGDILAFVGDTRTMDMLLRRPGLQRVMAPIEEKTHTTLPLFEVVVAASSELVGRSLREVNFRERYQGVVIGLLRQDVPVLEALGRLPIKAGDLLLIEAADGFARRWGQRHDEFYLVASRRQGRPKVRPTKGPIALVILLVVIGVAALGWASIVTTAFVGAFAMIVTGCLRTREAQRAIELPVLLVIAAALGLSKAIETTGLATGAANLLIGPAGAFGPIGVIAGIYIATSLLTEIITNNAAAALMIGVGLAAAQVMGIPSEVIGITVAIAASASFLTPIGYQTNLMVMAAGGYRFSDYLKSGFFANVIVAVVSLSMIQVLWF